MSIRQYIYKPQQVGLSQWPSGELRLEGIEVTTDPSAADIFTVPGALTALFPTREALYRLPYMRGRESRHVLLDCSDHEQLYDMPCLFIRCNTRNWYLKRDENTLSWSWPVEDYSECIEPPEGGFKYDVSFQGWVTSHETRQLSTDACIANPKLKCDIATYPDFCGYLYDRKTGKWTPEGLRRRAEFRRSMKESRIALCPESINGVFPYRFWEAMSAGRVPLLVGDGFIFPFADEIPYEDFIIQCPRELAGNAHLRAQLFLKDNSDAVIIEKGRMARKYWKRYLDSTDWPKTMAYAVQKHLAAVAQ